MGEDRIPLRHRFAAWLLDLEHVGWECAYYGLVPLEHECRLAHRPVWAVREAPASGSRDGER